jgi:hypothetical protein
MEQYQKKDKELRVSVQETYHNLYHTDCYDMLLTGYDTQSIETCQ